MADRICHLCGTHYNDDPYFKEQPEHTMEKCLAILEFRCKEAESEFREAKRELARANSEYKGV